MDKRYKILIGALIALSALGILILCNSTQGDSKALRIESITPSVKHAPQVNNLARCKRYIVDNGNYSGTECKGIKKDDARLNMAYCANGTFDACKDINGQTVTTTTIVYDSVLEACKDQIARTAQFGQPSCNTIAEDDIRLKRTYNLMYYNMLKCIDIELDTGIKCTYGTQHNNCTYTN